MQVLLSLLLTFVAGCTWSKSSGVLKLGPDTYTTSAAAARVVGGPSEARRLALSEGNEHCAKLSKEIMVTNIGSSITTDHGTGHRK